MHHRAEYYPDPNPTPPNPGPTGLHDTAAQYIQLIVEMLKVRTRQYTTVNYQHVILCNDD